MRVQMNRSISPNIYEGNLSFFSRGTLIKQLRAFEVSCLIMFSTNPLHGAVLKCENGRLYFREQCLSLYFGTLVIAPQLLCIVKTFCLQRVIVGLAAFKAAFEFVTQQLMWGKQA